MKEILIKGNPCQIDDEDYPMVSTYVWRLDGNGYAESQMKGSKGEKSVLMHRLINETPKGFETDHINHNILDNRRSNLRTVTHAGNQQNSSVKTKSGCRGIYTDKRDGLWRARIKVSGSTRYLGVFKNKFLAEQEYLKFSRARDIAASITIGGCCND